MIREWQEQIDNEDIRYKGKPRTKYGHLRNMSRTSFRNILPVYLRATCRWLYQTTTKQLKSLLNGSKHGRTTSKTKPAKQRTGRNIGSKLGEPQSTCRPHSQSHKTECGAMAGGTSNVRSAQNPSKTQRGREKRMPGHTQPALGPGEQERRTPGTWWA